jgi:DNA-binding Xre family transcriptional regulator
LASGYAAREKALGQSLGIAKPAKRWHRAYVFYHARKEACFVTRFYQEISEDAGKGTCNCETAIEQVEVGIMGKKNLGSGFDDFLEAEGLLEEATATAVKRFIAFQLAEKMSADNLSKSEMARRMATSRSALDRLLDPSNPAVTLQTLQSAAHALGGRLKVELDFQKRIV